MCEHDVKSTAQPASPAHSLSETAGTVHRKPSMSLGAASLLMPKKAPALVEEGAAFVEEGAALVEEGAAFVEEGAALVEEGAALVEEGAAFVQEASRC
jgi:hypothetical protein